MKRFIECLVPDSFCNLNCSYCYVGQQHRKSFKKEICKYSAEYIATALSPERLGGISYISITGLGETLIQKEVIDIVHAILKKGHYVNITTNGTVTKRFSELLDYDPTLLSHLNISFSLHFCELKEKGLIDTFFTNIKKVHNAGCSFVLQINLTDEYIPYWDEIKEICIKEVGAMPQVALTREECSNGGFKILTTLTKDQYIKTGKEMESSLFDFTVHNFNRRQRKYCYAGNWSLTLNLFTGESKGCYTQGITQNIYADLNKPIQFKSIGNCMARYCVNSSHFLSLGTIPGKKCSTYANLRNRPQANWYNPTMKFFLNEKLENDNNRNPHEKIAELLWYPKFCIRFMKYSTIKILKTWFN